MLLTQIVQKSALAPFALLLHPSLVLSLPLSLPLAYAHTHLYGFSEPFKSSCTREMFHPETPVRLCGFPDQLFLIVLQEDEVRKSRHRPVTQPGDRRPWARCSVGLGSACLGLDFLRMLRGVLLGRNRTEGTLSPSSPEQAVRGCLLLTSPLPGS